MEMESVFKKHKEEIKLYEKGLGKIRGRLSYSIAILSDIEEFLPEKDKVKLKPEIEEVKELIVSTLPEIEKIEDELKRRKLAEVL